MGKVSPKDDGFKTLKQRRRLRSSVIRYLKPGALAQLRYNKSSTGRSYRDLRREKVPLLHVSTETSSFVYGNDEVFNKSSIMMSPVNLFKSSNSFCSPKTPRIENCESDSRLESLHIDLLVKILCHLHHDELKPSFHVSQRIRKAVLLARQFYFNFTTPDRSRQVMLSTMTPRPTDYWPFRSKGDEKSILISSPQTPKAPRHGPRPPSRLKVSEMRQVATVLFQESAFPSRCMVPSVLPKPLCKSWSSNRVLFYEDELCQAVAQNKLH